ncbi:hypothetical protein F5884DRAFT_292290 [Xylogone sp. PMI_703]|nr:hypothetical protein F5884DRAFT_292290 [Xylogone sp. PMI_703]
MQIMGRPAGPFMTGSRKPFFAFLLFALPRPFLLSDILQHSVLLCWHAWVVQRSISIMSAPLFICPRQLIFGDNPIPLMPPCPPNLDGSNKGMAHPFPRTIYTRGLMFSPCEVVPRTALCPHTVHYSILRTAIDLLGFVSLLSPRIAADPTQQITPKD